MLTHRTTKLHWWVWPHPLQPYARVFPYFANLLLAFTCINHIFSNLFQYFSIDTDSFVTTLRPHDMHYCRTIFNNSYTGHTILQSFTGVFNFPSPFPVFVRCFNGILHVSTMYYSYILQVSNIVIICFPVPPHTLCSLTHVFSRILHAFSCILFVLITYFTRFSTHPMQPYARVFLYFATLLPSFTCINHIFSSISPSTPIPSLPHWDPSYAIQQNYIQQLLHRPHQHFRICCKSTTHMYDGEKCNAQVMHRNLLEWFVGVFLK